MFENQIHFTLFLVEFSKKGKVVDQLMTRRMEEVKGFSEDRAVVVCRETRMGAGVTEKGGLVFLQQFFNCDVNSLESLFAVDSVPEGD
ncbi:hypothetical protein L6452_21689 [Arctium lappa]|uniref:Uncharacterized protein n=1 Tax=Arctium lappa TaxID=4217 RepID=A0ACB9B231_ARCLA|nr:hypothetical protein L6452_21689 [Arctium lappa]